MQHMMAERRIIGRWCEIELSQHRRDPGDLSTRTKVRIVTRHERVQACMPMDERVQSAAAVLGLGATQIRAGGRVRRALTNSATG